MTNTEGIVLKLLLHSKNSEQALLAFSKLKEKHFTESYKPVYRAIVDFYTETEALPSINDLLIFKARSARVSTILSSLKVLDIDDLEMDVAVEALIDQHSQDVVLGLLDNFVDDLPLLNTREMLDYWGRVGIEFENSIESPEQVSTMRELSLFPSKEESLGELVTMGLSNKWDSVVSSHRQELALFGGKRGSGKSIMCANLVVNQMNYGNVGVYFTIEMTAKETFQRIQSIGSQVAYKSIRDNNLDQNEIAKIAHWAATQYNGGIEVYNKYFKDPAPKLEDFEKELKSTCDLKEEGRLVIVDDRELSLASIDVQLRKLKSKYGDKLKLVVIDYLNQVVWDGHESDMYDWKVQQIIAKQLKNLARKYDILIVSPYQMDDKGEARFSKGILDACDTAQLIEPDKETKTITFVPTKVRNSEDDIYTTVSINWECLTVHPEEVNIEELKQESAETEEPEFNSFPSGTGELV